MRLPYDYLTAINGWKPNPNVGTCAAAPATGNVVMILDFCAGDKWAELHHLPLALGLSCEPRSIIEKGRGLAGAAAIVLQ